MAALDFSQLTSQPSFGERYAQGQQQALQNQLAKQQLQMQSENALGLREERSALADQRRAATEGAAQRQAFLTGLGAKMSEGGHKLDRPTLSSMLQFGLMNKEGSVVELATKGLRALDEEDVYSTESARLGAGATDQNFTPVQIQNMLVSPSVRIREQGKALAQMTPKDRLLTPEEEAQKIRLATAGRAAPVDRLLTPEEEAQKIRLAAAQRPDRLLTPEEEAQKMRLTAAGRAPAQARAESAPVPVVDPATGKPILVSRERAIAEGMTPASAQEGLAPKEIQKREAALPKSTAAIKMVEDSTDKLIAQMQLLRNHPGLSGITGLIMGITPAITPSARSAQAILDTIKAKGTLSVLTAVRNASATGGALGNTSNKDIDLLERGFGALKTTQSTDDFKTQIGNVISDLEASKLRAREAYDDTYAYKTTAPAAAPSANAAKGVWGQSQVVNP
jgi:hypothetical protein